MNKHGQKPWDTSIAEAIGGQSKTPAVGRTQDIVLDTVAESANLQLRDRYGAPDNLTPMLDKQCEVSSEASHPRGGRRHPPTDRALAIRTELQTKQRKLVELTTALRVLLKRREQDQREFQDKVLYNVKQLIQPYLRQLKHSGISRDQKNILKVVEDNLDELVSSFLSRLSNQYLSLTPAEIRVANFIRQGKSSREIADLLKLSCRTVECHRDHIRGKLGLKHKKANLRTHLLSIGG